MTDWRTVFGHDRPYDRQVDGIETAVETARDRGFTVLEGACGTGKTMLALTAGISLVRDPDTDYERVFALTSVKQQLRQFEEDLRTINRNLPEDRSPVSALTLVGKADVCPYNRENAGDVDDANVYDRCEGLRERTRNLVDDGDGDGDAGGGAGATAGSASGDVTPADLVQEATGQQVALGESATYLETAGEPTPYARDTPEFEDVEFCPFYAQYLADLPEDGDPTEAVPFDLSEAGLIDTEQLVRQSAGHGSCPHSVMGVALSAVEVVVGNYYHAFDPTTVDSFTAPLVDEETFVVCDEAHMLEPRVRDLVSDRVADDTLRRAVGELTRVLQPLQSGRGGSDRSDRSSGDAPGGSDRDDAADPTRGVTGPDSVAGDREQTDADLIRAELADAAVSRREIAETRALMEDLRDYLDRRVRRYLDDEHPGWEDDPRGLDDEEVPLRDPESPGPDAVSEWADREGFDGGVWARSAAVGAFVGRLLDELEDEDRSRAAPAAGRTLANWYRLDHERYFRSIELERTWDRTEPADSWRRAYNGRLTLHNCVPSGPIGERLAEFGGGVLMSATLEPLDVFRAVTGLDRIPDDRPVVERTYGLHFPEENRDSFAVAAPKFTYDNRGSMPRVEVDVDAEDGAVTTDVDPVPDNPTRRAHVDAVREVAGLSGNVLVGMPSYREAEWMAGVLSATLDKPVLLDESSEDDVTEELKRRFFDGPGKVLVTSLRGTLTEGVDYRGDRLRAAVVCGVPIVNTASPRIRAVRTAYDRTFGDGFRYALAVPAVRKARQAIGRVIRGPEETGVRVLVDERYARESWNSVRDLVPDHEGFEAVSPDMLSVALDRFRERTGTE